MKTGALALTLALVVASCASHQKASPTKGSQPTLALDAKLDVGAGLRLHVQCSGEGVPVVVLDSGLGQGAEAWKDVQLAVAKFTRCCAYDRAGRGTSDAPSKPHSNAQMAHEMHTLLERAGVPAPYILAGHSMGGMNVQLLLAQHPMDVAGMVLLDSSPEPPPITQLPREAVADFEKNISELEGLDLKTFLLGFDELRASKRSLGKKPLVILIAGKALLDPNLAPEQAREQFLARQRSQAELASLSSNSVVITVEDSGHHLPFEAPAAVTAAIRSVVDAARNGSTLSKAHPTSPTQTR